MSQDAQRKHQLIYVADPMCSWCWGFAPVLSSLVERFGDAVEIDLVLGGLRPGTIEPMDATAKASIREHWEHVHQTSGQPFDFRFFDREGFVYDTEPASRAVVAARRLRKDAAHPFLTHLQAAFYRDNVDITDRDALSMLAAAFGFDRDRFDRALRADEPRNETRADYARARALGVHGFPSLLAPVGHRMTALTLGYRPWSAIEPSVASWLRQVADL